MNINPAATNPAAYAASYLDACIRNDKILMESSSLLSQDAPRFWNHVVPLLEMYGKRVNISKAGIEQLQSDLHNPKTSAQVCRNIEQVLIGLQSLIRRGLVQVHQRSGAGFAFSEKEELLSVMARFRMQFRLLLITQDEAFAEDAERLNSVTSSSGNSIQVRQINRYGYLSKLRAFGVRPSGRFSRGFSGDDPFDAPSVHNVGSFLPMGDAPRFRICTHVTDLLDEVIPVKQPLPAEGDTVYTDHGPLCLEKRIAGGGEGDVYTTGTPFVAKIYKEHAITVRRCEKLRRMLSRPLKCDGICCPVAPVKNSDGQLIGYLMPLAKGRELLSTMRPANRKLLHFPDWKKRDTVELCVTILEKICYLHRCGILLGDINPSNILVVSPHEVYFVDTDSYQIEDLPCPVGTTVFTAPEILSKRYPEFLRTPGNEAFAVATLLFYIMLPGKFPYAQTDGGTIQDNIRRMDFSYPLQEKCNQKAPEGAWRFMWSHLTYDLKSMFYHSFRMAPEGEHSEEAKRFTAEDWLAPFRKYLYLLDSGAFARQDAMSAELFPTRLKHVYRSQPIHATCTCSDCGASYDITEGEYNYFVQHGLPLPRRCPDCRRARRESHSRSQA